MHPIETPDKTFHDGDGVSELGTILPAWWLNQIQGELLGVLDWPVLHLIKQTPNSLKQPLIDYLPLKRQRLRRGKQTRKN